MNTDHYIIKSLELHLFFARIMKEHALFLRAGFTPANPSFAEKAEMYKDEFEKLLYQAIELGDGMISRKVVCSGELVTEFTAVAEKQTECLTGIAIDQELTDRELHFDCGRCQCGFGAEMYRQVGMLNQTALRLLDGLISFKEKILKRVLCGDMFTMNYPLLIEHIMREAKLYREYVECLEKEGVLSDRSMREVECFWNQIMMEHAMFIRGLLDPTEAELIQTADDFSRIFAKLLESCRYAHERTLTEDSLEETVRFRDFKVVGTLGI